MLGLAAYHEAESDDFIGCIMTGKKHFQHELKSSIVFDYPNPKYVFTIRYKIILFSGI
jgi:hypothetical protein